MRDTCPSCGRKDGPGLVLIGWSPCRCGGHRYTECRADKGGCGHTRYDPPRQDETCPQISFGYQGQRPI